MSEQTPSEPSMDEILASIRRIINDDPGAEARPVAAAVSQEEGAPDLKPEPEHDPAAPLAAETAAPENEPLISESASATTASAFDRLSSAAASASPPRTVIAMPPSGLTLEDVTRELLRPMLKAWLDEHLPAIVQDRVDEEVARIARGRAR